MKMCRYLNPRQVQWASHCIVDGTLRVTNPTEKTLARLGYMPLVDSERGDAVPGMVQVARYCVKNGVVLRSWVYEKEESL